MSISVFTGAGAAIGQVRAAIDDAPVRGFQPSIEGRSVNQGRMHVAALKQFAMGP
jgi:hypothetical protein